MCSRPGSNSWGLSGVSKAGEVGDKLRRVRLNTGQNHTLPSGKACPNFCWIADPHTRRKIRQAIVNGSGGNIKSRCKHRSGRVGVQHAAKTDTDCLPAYFDRGVEPPNDSGRKVLKYLGLSCWFWSQRVVCSVACHAGAYRNEKNARTSVLYVGPSFVAGAIPLQSSVPTELARGVAAVGSAEVLHTAQMVTPSGIPNSRHAGTKQCVRRKDCLCHPGDLYVEVDEAKQRAWKSHCMGS